MRVPLAYGRDGTEVEVPPDATVLEPRELPGLDDQHGEVAAKVRAALPERLPDGEVAVVFPDLTRPFPHRTVLPPLLEALAERGVAEERVVLCCATGTHRRAADAEMRELLGDELVERYRVHDHDCQDAAAHATVGEADGHPVRIDRAYTEAGFRITTGFVEPHFFAGYSGGPKGVCPVWRAWTRCWRRTRPPASPTPMPPGPCWTATLSTSSSPPPRRSAHRT